MIQQHALPGRSPGWHRPYGLVSPAALRRLSPHLPLVAATLLALAVRLYHLDLQSLWRDEVDVVRFSTESLDALSKRFLMPGENGPLYYLFHHYWLGGFGDSEIALRLPSALFGAAIVPVVYGLARLLLDPATARFSAFVVALSPYYVWYSQDGKMYSLLAFLTALSLYLYLQVLRTERMAAWIGYFLVATLGLYVHFFAALVIPAQVVLFLAFFRDRFWLPWLACLALLTLPYFPLAYWQIPTLISPPATGYPSFNPQGVATILLVLFARGFGPTNALLALALALFLLMSAMWLYRASSNGMGISPLKGVYLLLVFLLVPVAAFLLISLRLPLFTDRYLIVATPAFYLLVAAGITALRRHHRTAFWIAAAAWLALSLHSLAWQNQPGLKSDFRSAAASFASAAMPNDLVVFDMPYVRHAFQYYHRFPILWLDAPFTNGGQTPEQVNTAMEAQVRGRSVVWLVSSEEHLWDSRGLVRQWLQANYEMGEGWAHSGVRVERYLRPDWYLDDADARSRPTPRPPGS